MATAGSGAAAARQGAAARYGGRGRGDINLRIEVRVPEQTSAEERTLYERLRALAHREERPRRRS